MNNLEDKFKKAYTKIKECKNALLITHEHPDGDALSSVCALSSLLDSLSKKHTLFCIDKIPDFFSFLPNINNFTTKTNFDLKEFDLIIVLDCGCMARTKIDDKIKKEKGPDQYIIEFDHHPRVDNYTNLEIRMPEKSSTSEILYHFFKTNNLLLSKSVSNCILTGILTDTRNFLYPSANIDTIKVSSSVLSHGATFSKITQKTIQNKSLASMKILGKVLDNLKVNKKYSIAFSILTYEEIQEFKKDFKDNDDIFDSINGFLSNIKDVKIVMFLREEKIGKIKGSLRTNQPDMEVLDLAKFLGGGGHPKACGFDIEGRIEKTGKNWNIV